MSMRMIQEEGRAQEGEGLSGGSARRMPRRSVVRSLSTMHMMGFTPLGFFETVSEGENLVEGHMALPTGTLLLMHVSQPLPVLTQLSVLECESRLRSNVRKASHLDIAAHCNCKWAT